MPAEAIDQNNAAFQRPKPVVLCVLDGWGIAPPHPGNAIAAAHLPHFEDLIARYPVTALSAGGEAVGVRWGEMGNSKVGHLNLGAGRIMYQDIVRINKAISDGSFFTNPALQGAVEHVRQNGSALHVMGLLSTGGIHALFDHIIALVSLAKRNQIERLCLHLFLDGRDMPYNSARGLVAETERILQQEGIGEIATLSGRFYAMDRDNHWERIERAYRAMVEGASERTFTSADEAMADSYSRQVYDEEFEPTVLVKRTKPRALIADGDAVIFCNFRADRARQLTRAFTVPGFNKFANVRQYQKLYFATLTEYERNLPAAVAFKPLVARNTLGEVVARAGLRQLRLAETEKYAHVTYFFNGGSEAAYDGEERVVVPSVRAESYAEVPAMAANEITDRLLAAIEAETYDFILVNYANADMVGHTGNMEATVAALECLDGVMGKIAAAVTRAGGVLCITADHGNAETMFDMQAGSIDKEHTANPVPFLIVGQRYEGKKIIPEDVAGDDLSILPPRGMLADVAPTILKIMGLPEPEEMTGRSVL